jgi:hypothetical protein
MSGAALWRAKPISVCTSAVSPMRWWRFKRIPGRC